MAEQAFASGSKGNKKGHEGGKKDSRDKDNGHDNAKGVPEPSTLLLVGAGLAGAAAYRKIRNRNKTEL